MGLFMNDMFYTIYIEKLNVREVFRIVIKGGVLCGMLHS